MIYQNHVVDPTFFYDAIEEFAFDYVMYQEAGRTTNEYGRRVTNYNLQTIRGSLQSQGQRIVRSKEGNTVEFIYEFYCKSLYRINIGDVIVYKNNYLMCDSVHDFDEYGVRSATLKMITLTSYRDLAAFVKYIEGQELV